MDLLDSTKQCPSCGETKSGREFGVHLHKSRAKTPSPKIPRLATYCYDCMRRRQKEYRDRGGARDREMAYRRLPHIKARLKAQKIRRQYGIAEETYEALVEQQDNKCAACGNESYDGILRVDHCHDSDSFRGLLCNNCNAALGFLQNDPKRIEGLLHYINAWRRTHPKGSGLGKSPGKG